MATLDTQSQTQSQTSVPIHKVPTAEYYDELYNEQGEVREHWGPLYQSLMVERLGQLPQYNSLTQKLLRDDGASYSVHEDGAGLSRAWPLDVMPMLLPQTEWDSVAIGVAQRAHILDLVYQDIYGPQRLIRDGIIPPALIFGHPGYMRTWVGAPVPDQKQLIVYGVDMARGADGRFCAISERTQNPSGSGYSLENRIVSARVLTNLFRDSKVLRLASYFSSLRETLIKLAITHTDSPRIVLLTPGSHNETYFEQTFLSSYLGVTLVEGQDLIIKQGRVWMRSLSGEEPVDVIVRRVDDDYCDPLEFRGDSLLGVVGLTEVARAGNVHIVNPLGTGVLENPALYAYLPKIAEYFSESNLILDQVRTWWCGDPKHLQYTLAKLSELVIKPVWRQKEQRSILVSTLDKKDLQLLAAKIKSNPLAFVAQEQVQLSRVPCHNISGTEPRGLVLRAFAALESDDYQVMPGGLVRVSESSGQTMISNQSGSLSKDCWVLSSDQEATASLWTHPKHKLTDSAPEKLVYGRSAENLFWMGRYAERGDMALNILRNFGLNHVLGREHANFAPWQLIFVTDMTFTYPGFTDVSKQSNSDAINEELRSLCTNRSRHGSMIDSILRMTEASKNVQSLLSVELRRVIGQIRFDALNLETNTDAFSDLQYDTLIRLKDQLQAVNGLIGQSMIRGLAWRFLDIGRRLERAQRLLRLLQLMLVSNDEPYVQMERLDLVLSVTDSEVSYRQRYASEITVDRVLDLLLLEPDNPKSVAWQIKCLEEHLRNLPGRRDGRVASKEQRAVVEADTRIRLANSLELAQYDELTDRRELLNELLVGLQQQMKDAADAIGDNYFNKVTEKQQTLSPVIR